LDHERLLAQLVSWAEREDAIRAVVLTGSAARGPHSMDRLSDLDVELYVNEPARYLDDDSWYHQFGRVLVVEALDNPGWHPTHLVHYVGGKIDFMVGPADALAQSDRARPFKLLVDKDGLAAGVRSAPVSDSAPPEPADFLRCNQWFYAAALMCATAVARREPWLAKGRDWDAKQQLLQMIEWDHKARYGWSYETWHAGKHLDQWVDPDIRAQLDDCWAGFSLEGTAKALLASLDLFDVLSTRTAEATSFDLFDATAVRSEVVTILET
jgi:aminoglycoside 6-adenylyltransferase